MAGDESKRSEARTEPEGGAGTGEGSGSPSEPLANASQAPEGAAPSEPAAAVEPGTTDEPAAERSEAAEPAAATEAATSVPAEEAAVPASPLEAGAEPRARTPLLPRLIPYLVVFALGALLTIGAAFIMNILGGPPPETRGELDQRLAALDERAAALEAKQAQDRVTLGALADRFGGAETHARQASAAVREVEKALAARATSGGDGTSHAPVDLGPLAARLAAIEQRLEQDTAASGADAGAVAAAGIAQAQVQATAIVAGRLVQEVERGDAYLHELNALLALGVDESELGPLRPFATTGVASLRRLADDFAKLAPAVLATERKGTDASLVERLKGYASNLVQIERAGDLAGTDVHALVARIKFALAHDHVADAYALWSQLPEAAKIASERFGTSAKNRLDALEAARSIESGAVAALGKPKS
jgi:hypothetical protein